MHIPRPLLIALLTAPLVGCDASKPAPPTTAPSATSATSATGADAEKAAKLKSANPKDYKKTEEQALGTLPEGVGIAVGQPAPDFVLPGKKDTKTSLDDLVKGGEALLVFYRGGW